MAFWETFVNQKSATNRRAKLIDSVRYNLTQLMETEAPLVKLEDNFKESKRSVLGFGIEDMQLLQANLDPQLLAAKVQQWVTWFEPRLSQVRIEVLQQDNQKNAINFVLYANLTTEYGSEQLVLDSKINLNNMQVDLEDEELV